MYSRWLWVSVADTPNARPVESLVYTRGRHAKVFFASAFLSGTNGAMLDGWDGIVSAEVGAGGGDGTPILGCGVADTPNRDNEWVEMDLDCIPNGLGVVEGTVPCDIDDKLTLELLWASPRVDISDVRYVEAGRNRMVNSVCDFLKYSIN